MKIKPHRYIDKKDAVLYIGGTNRIHNSLCENFFFYTILLFYVPMWLKLYYFCEIQSNL